MISLRKKKPKQNNSWSGHLSYMQTSSHCASHQPKSRVMKTRSPFAKMNVDLVFSFRLKSMLLLLPMHGSFLRLLHCINPNTPGYSVPDRLHATTRSSTTKQDHYDQPVVWFSGPGLYLQFHVCEQPQSSTLLVSYHLGSPSKNKAP